MTDRGVFYEQLRHRRRKGVVVEHHRCRRVVAWVVQRRARIAPQLCAGAHARAGGLEEKLQGSTRNRVPGVGALSRGRGGDLFAIIGRGQKNAYTSAVLLGASPGLMSNEKHHKLLCDVDAWNRWKREGLPYKPKSDLRGADLIGADLRRADLRGATLRGATLRGADLAGADLTGAHLRGAHLTGANLCGTNLTGLNLTGADLTGADLTGAHLTGVDLTGATLVSTNFKDADLTGCRVFGTSVWDIRLEGANQTELVITCENESEITVDNLEVAQFIYLLLRNEKIRHVIDTITSKVALILGRFPEERKAVLDALRKKLRKRDYSPIVFDFEKSESRNQTETVSTLAHIARFVIADITDAQSISQELQKIVPK